MKQTAVEWLFLMLNNPNNNQEFNNKLFEQAKEMEKEEVVRAFERGRYWNMSWNGKSYYEEIIINGKEE